MGAADKIKELGGKFFSAIGLYDKGKCINDLNNASKLPLEEREKVASKVSSKCLNAAVIGAGSIVDTDGVSKFTKCTREHGTEAAERGMQPTDLCHEKGIYYPGTEPKKGGEHNKLDSVIPTSDNGVQTHQEQASTNNKQQSSKVDVMDYYYGDQLKNDPYLRDALKGSQEQRAQEQQYSQNQMQQHNAPVHAQS